LTHERLLALETGPDLKTNDTHVVDRGDSATILAGAQQGGNGPEISL
jgi:hypothetical protein